MITYEFKETDIIEKLTLISKCAKYCTDIYQQTSFDIENDEYSVQGSFIGNFLIFKGSDSIKDWKINLTLGKYNRKKVNGHIHRGYNNAFKSVKNPIEDYFSDRNNIVICGHSSGGALAIRTAYHLAQKQKNLICITFGSPKIGSEHFVNICNKSFLHIRVENFFDPVRLAPLFGFYSSGAKFPLWFIWNFHNMKTYQKKFNDIYKFYLDDVE